MVQNSTAVARLEKRHVVQTSLDGVRLYVLAVEVYLVRHMFQNYYCRLD